MHFLLILGDVINSDVAMDYLQQGFKALECLIEMRHLVWNAGAGYCDVETSQGIRAMGLPADFWPKCLSSHTLTVASSLWFCVRFQNERYAFLLGEN